jgi:hypothetical protein
VNFLRRFDIKQSVINQNFNFAKKTFSKRHKNEEIHSPLLSPALQNGAGPDADRTTFQFSGFPGVNVIKLFFFVIYEFS